MKSILNRIATALVITSLASVMAFAKTQTETVKFESDITVNGTVVSKGVYKLKFDDVAGELTISKDGKVIAKTPASTVKRDQKARRFELRSVRSGEEKQLTGIAFAGSDHTVVVGNSAASR